MCRDTPVHTQEQMDAQCYCKRLTALLKSVRKQMFGRMFSMGGTLLNKLHAEDQQCLSGWHTAETFSRVYSVKCTHLHPLHICVTCTQRISTQFVVQLPHRENMENNAITVISAQMKTSNFISLKPILFKSLPFQPKGGASSSF